MRIHRAGRTPGSMWIVRLALRRPYTFVVMGLTILLLGVFAIVTTPTDIFPEIEIPVVSVIWNYDGLTSEDMASRITRSEEHTSELQSHSDIVCRLLLEKKKKSKIRSTVVRRTQTKTPS